MPSFREEQVSRDKLLFDPNNYRFQDLAEFVLAQSDRFHEQSVQDRAYRTLRNDSALVQLKNSILCNGFLPFERLVVRPYGQAGSFYVVVEGNRRLAAVKWIADDYQAGVETPAELLAAIEKIPVTVVETGVDDAIFSSALMGIRHVSGIKEWGGYQRAKLVADLKDEHSLDTSDVANRLGMGAREVNRRYNAFKALQQMIEDEEFGGYASAGMYPIFHEALALPALREWLAWDNDQNIFTHGERLRQLYGLITPSEEEDEERSAKITTREQIRDLPDILINPEARQVLFDPRSGFSDAATVVQRDRLSGSWPTKVAEAVTALKGIPAHQLKTLGEDELEPIRKLMEVAQELLSDYGKLRS